MLFRLARMPVRMRKKMKKVGSCLYLYSMVLLWHINAIYEGIRKKVAKKA